MLWSPSRRIWQPSRELLTGLTLDQWERGERPWHRDRNWSPGRVWCPGLDVERRMHALGIIFPGVAAVRREVTAAAASSPVPPNPDAFWRFEEASGTRNDSTTGGNNLASTGTINSASGKIGNGASLPNANGTYLDHSSNSTLAPAGGTLGSYSVGVWFNPTVQPLAGGLNNVIVSKWGYSGATNRSFRLQILGTGATNKAEFLVNPNALAVDDTTVTWSAGTWHCILAWYDSVADTINIQVDGGTITSSSTAGSGINAATSTNFRVSGDFAFNVCNGVVDNLALWHVVLNSSQRTAWYKTGSGTEWVSGAWV